MHSSIKQTHFVSNLWETIKEAIARIVDPSSAVSSGNVRVWTVQRPDGHAEWRVYNASVRQYERLSSEDEVMEWIEESYHHTGDAARQFWFFL